MPLDTVFFQLAVNAMTNVHMAAIGMPAPPVNEGFVSHFRMAKFPVQLGSYIIDPAIACPEQDVGIEVVIIGLTCGCGTAHRVFILVAPYAKGRDPEFAPGLFFLDGAA